MTLFTLLFSFFTFFLSAQAGTCLDCKAIADCVRCLEPPTLTADDRSKLISIDISQCKGSDISWFCCRHSIDDQGNIGACDIKTCDGDMEPSFNKCSGVSKLVFEVPPGATSFVYQLHDGSVSGNVTCSGTGEGSTCCGGSGANKECGSSGVCSGVISSCGCKQDSDCPASTLCGSYSCVDGTCKQRLSPKGTPCSEGASSQCSPAAVCNGVDSICPERQISPDGTTCDDGNKCTKDDSCRGGRCSGSTVTCLATDQCHAPGVCDPATGSCSDPEKTGSCSDSNLCTTDDTCVSGKCQGKAISCPPPDQCHVGGACNAETGTCTNIEAALGTPCNDGSRCTHTDSCTSGKCGGIPVTCKALDQCHVPGRCNAETGSCENPEAPLGTTCNDGNPCTHTDTCTGGVCRGIPVVCEALDQCHIPGVCSAETGKCSNPVSPDGSFCNDGLKCTTRDACIGGVCKGTNVVCKALDQCHVPGVCSPETGKCSDPNAADGTGCTDGDACTRVDGCKAGACVGTNSVVCTALDQCHTVGVCSPSTGKCSDPVKPDATPCDDTKKCTTNDVCTVGTCGGNVLCSKMPLEGGQVYAGQWYLSASLNVYPTEKFVVVKYTATPGWTIAVAHIYFGYVAPARSAPGTWNYIYKFPTPVTTWEFKIPLSDLAKLTGRPNPMECGSGLYFAFHTETISNARVCGKNANGEEVCQGSGARETSFWKGETSDPKWHNWGSYGSLNCIECGCFDYSSLDDGSLVNLEFPSSLAPKKRVAADPQQLSVQLAEVLGVDPSRITVLYMSPTTATSPLVTATVSISPDATLSSEAVIDKIESLSVAEIQEIGLSGLIVVPLQANDIFLAQQGDFAAMQANQHESNELAVGLGVGLGLGFIIVVLLVVIGVLVAKQRGMEIV